MRAKLKDAGDDADGITHTAFPPKREKVAAKGSTSFYAVKAPTSDICAAMSEKVVQPTSGIEWAMHCATSRRSSSFQCTEVGLAGVGSHSEPYGSSFWKRRSRCALWCQTSFKPVHSFKKPEASRNIISRSYVIDIVTGIKPRSVDR